MNIYRERDLYNKRNLIEILKFMDRNLSENVTNMIENYEYI